MSRAEPIGILKFHHIEHKQNSCAVYCVIFFEDENGKIWKCRSSSFLFELEEVTEDNDIK